MKKYIGFLLFTLLFSCKTKQAVVTTSVATEKASAEKIIDNYYTKKYNFKTVILKTNVSYEDEKQSQNVAAEIKILKDQKILISIKILGITLAKALITPNGVQYYEKIKGTYFEGNYETLSKWLGTDLDYYKLQNMLLGCALDDLTKEKYTASIEENLYKLENLNQGIVKNIYLETPDFLVQKQVFNQIGKNRRLQITYPNHQKYPEATLPTALFIEALINNKKTNISLEYGQAVFNEDLSFVYSAPEDYKKISVDSKN